MADIIGLVDMYCGAVSGEGGAAADVLETKVAIRA